MKPGKLTLITGPMGSGKTNLLRLFGLDARQRGDVIAFRPSSDTRAPHGFIYGWVGQSIVAEHKNTLDELRQVVFSLSLTKPITILVDEIHLFPDADRAGKILPALTQAGHDVYAAGLRYGWSAGVDGRPLVMPWRDSLIGKGTWIAICPTCECGVNPSLYTRRLTPLPPDGSPIAPNTPDTIVACCISCWRPPPSRLDVKPLNQRVAEAATLLGVRAMSTCAAAFVLVWIGQDNERYPLKQAAALALGMTEANQEANLAPNQRLAREFLRRVARGEEGTC